MSLSPQNSTLDEQGGAMAIKACFSLRQFGREEKHKLLVEVYETGDGDYA